MLLLTSAPISQGKNEVPMEWEVGQNTRGGLGVLEDTSSLLPLPELATHIALGGTEDKHVKPDRYYFVPSCSGL